MATIDELRAKAAEIDDTVESSVENARQSAILLLVGLVLVVLLAFVVGRRGRKKVVVQVRRR